MRKRPTLAAATAALVVLAGLGALQGTSQASTVLPRDGSSAARAALSCWAIKQTWPTKPSGLYWLQTPQLVVPQQFYCDQTSAGGGWVLVGRGREGWSFRNDGQGSAQTLRTVRTGPSAFAPAALPSATIDGLMNGGAVSALHDGVRIRRAMDAAGTRYQEMQWRFGPLQNWAWNFGGDMKLVSVTRAGRTYTTHSPSTRNWMPNNDYTRHFTYRWKGHGNKAGFSYGSTVIGSSSPTSHLWQLADERHAIPFAQVYIRPRLTSATYAAVPATGAPARTVRPLMQTRTEPAPWGVTGVVGNGTGDQNVEVQAFATSGRTMYVGGKFRYVQKGQHPRTGEKVEQSYLAAFNIDTGNWISGFRPRLNGQVWDLQVVNGRLIAGGEFTSVGGAGGTAGIAALDLSTGALAPGWRTALRQSSTTEPRRVKALDVQGGWLYLGGNFNSLAGGRMPGTFTPLRNAARVSVSDGTPDRNWRPHFDGTVIELDASDRGDRVYLVGHFTHAGTVARNKVAVLSTATHSGGTPALIAGLKSYRPSSSYVPTQYQQVVKELGGAVWQGGAQHNLHRYSRGDYTLLNSFITRRGGDFQAIVEIDGVVYASCHCYEYVYVGANSYPTPTGYSRVDDINWVGAWDARTGAHLREWTIPHLSSEGGDGPWDLAKDAKGCLWMGGDLHRGSFQAGVHQWLGGFARVCPRDTVAPAKPTGLTAARTSGGVSVRWTAVAGAAHYEVLRGDRVVATSTGTSVLDNGATAGTYFVRAVDAAGNRSATTAGVTSP